MSTTTGSLAIQEQPSVVSYTPGLGYRTTRVWRGPTAAVDAQFSSLVASGYAATIRRGFGGVDTVEGTVGADASSGGTIATPQEIWTLVPNVVEKDLLEANISAVAGISKEDKATIRKHIESPEEGVSPAVTGDALEAYLLMLHGVRTWQVEQPVLQGSYLCSASYVADVTTTNVNKILTNAQLQSLEGAPSSLIIVPLPSSSATSQWDGSGDKPDARYGWRKRFPTVEQVGFDQFRVSVQFEYGLWADLLYPDAS